MSVPRDEDAAARRLSEALHARAVSGGRVPPPPGDRGPSMPPAGPGRYGPPPAPRPMPGRVPPPAPRPMPPPAAPAGSDRRQIVWALVVTLLIGAILGAGIGLVSILLPGALPTLG